MTGPGPRAVGLPVCGWRLLPRTLCLSVQAVLAGTLHALSSFVTSVLAKQGTFKLREDDDSSEAITIRLAALPLCTMQTDHRPFAERTVRMARPGGPWWQCPADSIQSVRHADSMRVPFASLNHCRNRCLSQQQCVMHCYIYF